MNKFINIFKHNPLYFSFFLPMAMDGITTLVGQDPSYWLNYKSANELSPAYFIMAAHPFFFILGAIIWFVGLYWIFKKLRHPINLIIACGFIAGNTWGSTSWITSMMKKTGLLMATNRSSILFTWVILVFYFSIIGICAGLSIAQYFKNKSRE